MSLTKQVFEIFLIVLHFRNPRTTAHQMDHAVHLLTKLVSNTSSYLCASTEESPLLPVNNNEQEYCITNDGDVLLNGDSWKANACTSCTCNNGTIQCFSQHCPAANCRVPVLRKGQCCPYCIGEYPGASWQTCLEGSYICSIKKKKPTLKFHFSK